MARPLDILHKEVVTTTQQKDNSWQFAYSRKKEKKSQFKIHAMKTDLDKKNTETQTEGSIKGKVEKKNGKRIGFYYIIYKSLKENPKNDVMKCLYIKGLFNFGKCVIKEGTIGDSKDVHGRDIRDRLIWQKQVHELLQNRVRLPRYIDSFEENGNHYLVIEHIQGESLVHMFRKHSKDLREGVINRNRLGIKFIDYLLNIVDILETLHNQNIVHRDATSNNFMITPRGEVAIIDMELSYSLDSKLPNPPFQLGTHGFMSPQQIAALSPTKEEDIFALGAIILHMWTYISPNKITDAPPLDLATKISFLIPNIQIASMVIKCLDPIPTNRPNLQEIRKAIQQYKVQPPDKTPKSSNYSYIFKRTEIINAIARTINTFSTDLMADADYGWFSENTKSVNYTEKDLLRKAWFASFSKGAAGIIYTLSQAQLVGFDITSNCHHLNKGLDLIEEKYINKKTSSSPSLYYGAAGIAVTISAAITSNLVNRETKYIEWIDYLLNKENKKLDVMDGIAGQGLAHLICFPTLNKKDNQLHKHIQAITESQQRDGSWIFYPNDRKKITRGFLNGTSGILYFLLQYLQKHNDSAVIPIIEKGLLWLIKKSNEKNGKITWTSSSGKEILPWWSQGAIGIAFMFIKAFSILHDPTYKKYAVGALNNHQPYLVNNNLSQSNGLSGLGEVYLDAYKTFNDTYWLEQADWIAQTILHMQKIHPKYGPYWLVDHEKHPLPGFMTGNSGVLHFLIRHSFPDEISFPLVTDSQLELKSSNKAALEKLRHS